MTDETRTLSVSKKHRCRVTKTGVVVAALLTVAAARADVVGLAGKPPTIDVKITAFRGGQIEYQISSAREAVGPVEEIDYLQITNWPLFNLAEQQQRDGHVQRATSNYERLLKQTLPPAQGELDRGDPRSRTGPGRAAEAVESPLRRVHLPSGGIQVDRCGGQTPRRE